MKKGFQIADLIVAFIKGEISADDLVVLDAWLEEAEENKALFVSIMDEAVFEKEKADHTLENVEFLFEKIKIQKQQIRKRRQLRVWTSVAAGIVILFSVFWVFRPLEEAVVVADNTATISVGKQIAYLLLSTGERVVLQEHQQDTITLQKERQQIILNNGRLEIERQDTEVVMKEEYHTMEIPRGAEYQLVLPDGSRVWLNADSKLKFPTQFYGPKRYVELSGEAYFEVIRDETRPFVVHSDDVDITVLGTEFCIRNYVGKPALTTLVKGSVEVKDRSGWQTILKPGQQSVTFEGSNKVRDVETIYYTAWKDGYFIFEDTPLEEIMEELSLWYNCQYFFQNQKAADIRITARMKKYDEIDVLLGILSKTNEIQMEKNGNTILIRQK